MRLGRMILMLAAAAGATLAQGPSWDTSGNGLLNGTYYFRQTYYLAGDGSGDFQAEMALYGNINFSGTGTYTLSNTTLIYYYNGITSSPYPSSGTFSGTYSIASSGSGFLSALYCPYSSGCGSNSVYVTVAHGILAGSSTESNLNDLFLATQVPPTLATNATFSGTWNMAGYIPPPIGSFPAAEDASDVFFTLSPDGAGHLGNVNVTGYNVYTNGSGVTTQTDTNLTYSFASGAASIVFPNNTKATSSGSISYFLAGAELLYFSPDGTFCFGGSTGYPDMLAGVKAPTSGVPSLAGIYATAGITQDETQVASGFVDLQTLYGSLNAFGGNVVENDRIQDPFQQYTYNTSYYDSTAGLASGGTYNNGYINFAVNGSGTVRIGAAVEPLIGLYVAVQVPTLTGSGVLVYPTGVADNASGAPFTAGISGGQFLTIYGQNLANTTALASTLPLPTTLGNNVQVKVNGIAAPLDYVSPGQINFVVPFSVSNYPIATIQVSNGGQNSNIITQYVRALTPGVFGGVNAAAALHDATYQPVTTGNPIQPGETIDVFAGGFGAVYPPVADGSAGPSNPLSNTTNTVTAYVGGIQSNVYFAGLAPGYAGLYQIQIVVPSTVTAGAQTLEIDGTDTAGNIEASTSVSYLQIGGTTAAARTSSEALSEQASTGRRAPRVTPSRHNLRGPIPAVAPVPKAASF